MPDYKAMPWDYSNQERGMKLILSDEVIERTGLKDTDLKE